MAANPMRIALVKMSSMGDVIHALPVVSDLLNACPGAHIDWIVDEAFAALPGLHPGVREVLPIPLRRWRRQWQQQSTWRELMQIRAAFGKRHYDVVLDLQGLLKSAWVAGWLRGERVGYARACAREPMAALAYRRRFAVDMQAHAIEKMRSLAGQAFDYTPAGLPLFGLAAPPVPAIAGLGVGVGMKQPYRVLLHATSRPEKLWPMQEWVALLRSSAAAGRRILLPWGSAAEQAVATELVDKARFGEVLPRLDLLACAGLLGSAEAVVGVDTGLTHLAAALGTPTIALFAATESSRYGPYWSSRAISLGADGQWPTALEVSERLASLLARPA